MLYWTSRKKIRKTCVRGFNSVAQAWTDPAVVKLQTNDLITRSILSAGKKTILCAVRKNQVRGMIVKQVQFSFQVSVTCFCPIGGGDDDDDDEKEEE